MKPVWQNITGFYGNCMQATIASLLELDLDQVPHFRLAEKRALKNMIEFMSEKGYSFTKLLTPKTDLLSVKSEEGVNGYFFAIVRSKTKGLYHAVVIDRQCNIVHPTNIKYAGITEFEKRSEGEINGILYIFVFSPASPDDTEESLRKKRLTRKNSIRKSLF